MSAEPIKEVIKLWETKKITEVQIIGKLLIWFLNLYTEQVRLKAQLSRLEKRLAKVETRPDKPDQTQ